MSRVHVLVIATMASLWGHQAGADVSLSTPSLRPKPGEEVFVVCTLTAGEAYIGWYKISDGSKVSDSSSETVRVKTDGNRHTLRFTDVKVSQGGQYECRGGLNKKTFELQVAFDRSGVDPNQHVTIGQTQNIKLGVSGYPKPTVTWKKGTRPLNPASDPHYTLLDDGSLRINIVRIDDEGNYTFSVQQVGYTGRGNIEVYAVEIPKIEPFQIRTMRLTQGHSASFVCKATGRPTPKYKWYNPSGSIISSFGGFFIKDGNLTIKSVGTSLKGIYRCEAYNEIARTGEKIGEDEATVEIVEVLVAPKISSKGGDKDLARGEDFTLECKATGTPLPNVVWKRNGNRDPRQEQSAGESIIKFTNIQAVDGGKYTCEARNSAVDSSGKDIVAVLERNINIRSLPFIITHASPYEVYSYLGNSHPTFVTCTFGGFPKPWIIMTFDKKMVSNATTTANFSVVTDAKKKFGKFHCFAKNIYGSKNQTVELKEVGKPSEVLDFQAEPTCDSVALTWKLPLKDGGMPIDKFVLEYKGSTRNIGASKTEITITGLKQNTDYTFNIRATNRGEWGPITSQQVKTEKYCVPGRPVIYQPKSVEIDQTSFTLKWRRPQATGGDDDIEYIVRYRDETDDDKPGPWKEFITKKLEYKIKDLEKQKKYKVEVIAKNDAGKGTPDERFYQTGKVLGTGSQSQLVASLLLTFTVYILHLL